MDLETILTGELGPTVRWTITFLALGSENPLVFLQQMEQDSVIHRPCSSLCVHICTYRRLWVLTAVLTHPRLYCYNGSFSQTAFGPGPRLPGWLVLICTAAILVCWVTCHHGCKYRILGISNSVHLRCPQVWYGIPGPSGLKTKCLFK